MARALTQCNLKHINPKTRSLLALAAPPPTTTYRMWPLLSCLALALVVSLAAAQEDWSGWTQGRATFYGNDDGYSIDQGSCGFGSSVRNMGTGNNIAALSDKNSDYAGSCGRCYEVTCRPGQLLDGYGSTMDRHGACNGGKVVVMVSDSCPCWHPSNSYSNTRWCCGDQPHMDLSYWAFAAIADTGAGAINTYYRQVACPGSSGSSGGSSSSSSASSTSDGGSSSAFASASSSSSGGDSSSSSWSSSSSSGSSSSSSASASSSSGGGDFWVDAASGRRLLRLQAPRATAAAAA